MYLFPHNSAWTSEYLNESKAIASAYQDSIQLHHIGSTAVKNLFAKDCIDILGIVENILDAQKNSENLTSLGYLAKGEYGVSDREYFSKTNRKVHLHIFQKGDLNIRLHLNFVKTLSENPELVKELNALKIDLHTKYPQNKGRYQEEKVSFYNKIHKML